MARYQSSILLLAILLIACDPLPSQSLSLINGSQIAQVTIGGILSCSATGNPIAGSATTGVAGALVNLVCGGSQTSLAQAVTNVTGAFQFVLNTVDSVLFDSSSCRVTVNLPAGLGNCTLLPPTGVLAATPSLVGVVPTVLNGLVAFVANFVTGAFAIVPTV